MDVFVVSFVDCLNFSLVCILPCATSQDRAVKLSSRGRVTSRYARALLQTSETILSANIETISQFRDFIWWWHRPASDRKNLPKIQKERMLFWVKHPPSPCSWICCNLFTSLWQTFDFWAACEHSCRQGVGSRPAVQSFCFFALFYFKLTTCPPNCQVIHFWHPTHTLLENLPQKIFCPKSKYGETS